MYIVAVRWSKEEKPLMFESRKNAKEFMKVMLKQGAEVIIGEPVE